MLSIRYLSLYVAALLLTSTAGAQIAGTPSSAARLAPVDASALGVTRGSSIGVSADGDELVLQGGPGIAGGSLRGLLGVSEGSLSTLGAGYARTLAGSVMTGIRGTIGGELVGGFRFDLNGTNNDYGLHLTIPAALTFGDPNRLRAPALALYAAPYAELGSTYSYIPRQCTPYPCFPYDARNLAAFATGLGFGTRLSFGKFAADLLIRDYFGRDHPGQATITDATLGIDYRIGK